MTCFKLTDVFKAQRCINRWVPAFLEGVGEGKKNLIAFFTYFGKLFPSSLKSGYSFSYLTLGAYVWLFWLHFCPNSSGEQDLWAKRIYFPSVCNNLSVMGEWVLSAMIVSFDMNKGFSSPDQNSPSSMITCYVLLKQYNCSINLYLSSHIFSSFESLIGTLFHYLDPCPFERYQKHSD